MKHSNALFVQLIICICIGLIGSSATAQTDDKRQNADITVETNGSGSTAAEARTEAIRSALQQVVPQIIVADRIVKDDKLIMDSVMSSMNGHVQSITTLDERRSGDRVDGSYRITVSTSEISSFLTSRFGSSANVDGNSLGGEVVREREARDFRNQYIKRLFRGFPTGAIITEINSIDADPNDFNKLIISFKSSLDKDWIASLRSAFQQISCNPKNERCNTLLVCFGEEKVNFFGMVTDRPECMHIKPGPERDEKYSNIIFYPAFREGLGGPKAGGVYYLIELLSGEGDLIADKIYKKSKDPTPIYTRNLNGIDQEYGVRFSSAYQYYSISFDTKEINVDRMKTVRITPVFR